MLSLTRDLLKKTQDKSAHEIKPLTVCFWSDFEANPAVMYELFSTNPRQLDYNPEKVKVMGTADGMIKLVQYSVSRNYCALFLWAQNTPVPLVQKLLTTELIRPLHGLAISRRQSSVG